MRGAITRGSVTEDARRAGVRRPCRLHALQRRETDRRDPGYTQPFFRLRGCRHRRSRWADLEVHRRRVLAVFLLDQGTPDTEVAANAIDAAIEAQRLYWARRGCRWPRRAPCRARSSGNHRHRARLDFTVMSQAVNEVARMEPLCGLLGEPILVSAPWRDFCHQTTNACDPWDRRRCVAWVRWTSSGFSAVRPSAS